MCCFSSNSLDKSYCVLSMIYSQLLLSCDISYMCTCFISFIFVSGLYISPSYAKHDIPPCSSFLCINYSRSRGFAPGVRSHRWLHVRTYVTIAFTPPYASSQWCQLQPAQQGRYLNGRWRIEQPQMATFVVSFTICHWRWKYTLCWFWIPTLLYVVEWEWESRENVHYAYGLLGSHERYLVSRYKRFGGTCCRHLQGRKGTLIYKGIMCEVGERNKMWMRRPKCWIHPIASTHSHCLFAHSLVAAESKTFIPRIADQI